MLCYPAILEKDPETGTVMVSFPDIPFAHAVGDDEAEALLNAEDALVTAFEIFSERDGVCTHMHQAKLFHSQIYWLRYSITPIGGRIF